MKIIVHLNTFFPDDNLNLVLVKKKIIQGIYLQIFQMGE